MRGRRARTRSAAPRRWWVLVVRLSISVVMLGVLLWRVPQVQRRPAPARTGTPTPRCSSRWRPRSRWSASCCRRCAGAPCSRPRPGREAAPAALLQPRRACSFRTCCRRRSAATCLRVSRLSKENGESAASFASVVLERLTGWLVLPVITLVGLLVNPGLRHLGNATRVAVALSIGTLVALGVVLLGVASHRFGSKVTGQRRLAALRRRGPPRHGPAAPAIRRPRSTCSSSGSRTSSCSCSPR